MKILHILWSSTLLSLSPRKENVFFLPSKEQQGLSFLGQAKICLLVRGDRRGWRGLASQKQSAELWFWLLTRTMRSRREGNQAKCHLTCCTANLQYCFKNYT